MLGKIKHFISTLHLPEPPAHLIVALSGGADSVALLLILQQLGYRITAGHCNFHLRGEESNRDEMFVRHLCSKRDIPLEVVHFDTEKYAQANGISIEMAARELRYNWFEKLLSQLGASAIAVAHHGDDNAETLLLNLIRGTGLHGLKGMLPQNGNIIRPLLCVKRKDLEKFLQEQHQTFVTDSTNLETVYKRNKIRHQILPLLRELNPAADETLAGTARRLAEAELLYNLSVGRLKEDYCQEADNGSLSINLQELQRHPAAATLLHEWLTPFGFSPAEIALIVQQPNRPTGTLFEAGTYLAVFHRGNLIVSRRPQTIEPLVLPPCGETCLPNGKKLILERLSRSELTEIPKCPEKVALDAETIHGNLFLRSTLEADRFQPFGMRGSKLISDYLTDRHRSIIDKMQALVLCDANGVLWLLNERIAQRAAVTPSTKEILLLKILSPTEVK